MDAQEQDGEKAHEVRGKMTSIVHHFCPSTCVAILEFELRALCLQGRHSTT
jgi:hypothetical protein